MPEDNGLFYDEFELPKNRRKRILDELDEIDDDGDSLLPFTSSEEKRKARQKEEEEKSEDTALFISTLSSLSRSKMKTSRSPKDIFGKKKKDKKKKKANEPTDFAKEFEPEVALLDNLLSDQSRFVTSLQQKYDKMESQKSSARGTGKFTTDLISNINQARQLSAQLIDKKISTKKAIAELEMKERKELGANMNSDDLNNFAAEYLKNIITTRPDMPGAYGNYEIGDVDDDGIISAIDSNIEDERGDEVAAYLKYENANVTIKVLMNPDNLDDYDFIAETEDGEILDDYPLPEHTTLSLNRSTMIATDAYGKKYHTEFRDW